MARIYLTSKISKKEKKAIKLQELLGQKRLKTKKLDLEALAIKNTNSN